MTYHQTPHKVTAARINGVKTASTFWAIFPNDRRESAGALTSFAGENSALKVAINILCEYCSRKKRKGAGTGTCCFSGGNLGATLGFIKAQPMM